MVSNPCSFSLIQLCSIDLSSKRVSERKMQRLILFYFRQLLCFFCRTANRFTADFCRVQKNYSILRKTIFNEHLVCITHNINLFENISRFGVETGSKEVGSTLRPVISIVTLYNHLGTI